MPRIKTKSADGDLQQRLDAAEFFIKDLGVWEHYQKFLRERDCTPVQKYARCLKSPVSRRDHLP